MRKLLALSVSFLLAVTVFYSPLAFAQSVDYFDSLCGSACSNAGYANGICDAAAYPGDTELDTTACVGAYYGNIPVNKCFCYGGSTTTTTTTTQETAPIESFDAKCDAECSAVGYEKGVCDSAAYENDLQPVDSPACNGAVYNGQAVDKCFCYAPKQAAKVCGRFNDQGVYEKYCASSCGFDDIDEGLNMAPDICESLVAEANQETNLLVAQSSLITGAATAPKQYIVTPTCQAGGVAKDTCIKLVKKTGQSCYYVTDRQKWTVTKPDGRQYTVYNTMGECRSCNPVNKCEDYTGAKSATIGGYITNVVNACVDDMCGLGCTWALVEQVGGSYGQYQCKSEMIGEITVTSIDRSDYNVCRVSYSIRNVGPIYWDDVFGTASCGVNEARLDLNLPVGETKTFSITCQKGTYGEIWVGYCPGAGICPDISTKNFVC